MRPRLPLPAALVVALVLAVGAAVAVGVGLGVRSRRDVLTSVAMGAVFSAISFAALAWRSARSNAPTESLLLDGTDDAVMRHAAAVLRARGVRFVDIDRPARTVRGWRMTVVVEPDEKQPGRCRVTVRAAPLLASRHTNWEPYRTRAAEVAQDLAEFRTRTAGTT